MLAYSDGRCEASCEGGWWWRWLWGCRRRHWAAGGSTDRLFGLGKESPGAAQQSGEGD